MSIFDEERKQLGIQPIGQQKASGGVSMFDAERRRLHGEEKTYMVDPFDGDRQQNASQVQKFGNIGSVDTTQSPLMQAATHYNADPGVMNTSPAQYSAQLPKLVNTQPAKKEPDLPGRGIPLVRQAIQLGNWISNNPFSNAVAEYAQPNAPFIDQPNTNVRQQFLQDSGIKPATGVAKLAGQMIAPFAVPGAELGVGNAVETAAKNALTRTSIGGLSKSVLTGAAAGAYAGAGSEFAQGNGNLKDAALQGASGAALGGGLFGLGEIGSQALGKWMSKNKTVAPEAEAAAQRIFNTYKNPAGPQTLDEATNSIMQEVSNRITPPLENPKLLDKYLQLHLPEIPKSELDQLHYNDKAELATHIKDNLNIHDVASQVAKEKGLNWQDISSKAPTSENVAAYSPNVTESPITRPIAESVQVSPRTISRPVEAHRASQIAVTPSIFEAERNAIPGQRGFVSSLQDSPKIAEEVSSNLNGKYKPITNVGTVEKANTRISADMEKAAGYVMGDAKPSAEKVVTAIRLIDEFSKSGNHERAVAVAEKVAAELTRAGQTVQAASLLNRLSVEGVLIRAQRIAARTNETLSKMGKEVKVTPDMAASLTDLATTAQKMTGVKDLSNNVIDILDRAKAGEKLSSEDTSALKKFVEESKQFVKEVSEKPKSPRAPKQPSDKRVRDNVISFLDAQEQAAKERLRARGIRISSTPIDIWVDYAIIGATKMAKGAIKFGDWSEQMVRDLGEEVRPHLANLYEKARETFELSTKKVTQRTVSQAERITESVIKKKNLSPAEADYLRFLAQKVSGLSGDAKTQASQDLQYIMQQLERPGVLRKIGTIQTTAQLLNPKTQVRNVIGNELFYRLERVQKLISTPIDMARAKLTGGDRTVSFRTHNQGEYWKNWLQGWKAGWRGVNINGLESQFDVHGQSFRSKLNPFTYLEKTMNASLRSFDNAAYMRVVNNTLGEMANLRAINEGLTGEAKSAAIQKYIRESDDNLRDIADRYGKYATFQDNNVISKSLTQVKRTLNFGKDFGIGDLVLKYPKTPGALLMRALEYSPAGFLRSAYMAAKPVLQKGEKADVGEITQAITRGIIGTAGLSGLGYFLLDKGILTGAQSKDKDIRDLQRSAGQGQYQINLSAFTRWVTSGFKSSAADLREGDRMYTYDWAQPVSMAVSLGANVGKNVLSGDAKSKGLATTAYDSFEGGVNSLTEQSVLSGLRQAVQGYPGQSVMDKVADIFSSVPSSFVPTAANQVRTAMDNSKRETYSPDKMQQSMNLAKTKIPGLASTLPQQTDTLGKPKTTYQDNNLFNVFLNPGTSSKYELTPEARMIVDLIHDTGDESLAPRVPGKTLNYRDDAGKSATMKMNGEQFARMQKLQGTYTQQLISKIPQNASTETKQAAVQKALTTATEYAKRDLRNELGLKQPKK